MIDQLNIPDEFKSFFGWIEQTGAIKDMFHGIGRSDSIEKVEMWDELIRCFQEYNNENRKHLEKHLKRNGRSIKTATQDKIINRWKEQLRLEIFGNNAKPTH